MSTLDALRGPASTFSRPIRYRRCAVALALCAGLAGGLGGCTGHGKYTREHIENAQEKISLLKSGTEWQMAQQQFLAGDLDKALKTVDRSIQLNPTVPKSHVLRGRILIELGRLEPARESLVKAQELEPENVEAAYYLGVVHERFSEPAEALAFHQRAAELDPTNPQYTLAAAEMMIQMGQLDEARAMLEARKAAFQYNAAVRQTLGHIAMLTGETRPAAVFFNEALTLAPDDHGILEDLARAQVASGQFSEADYNLSRLLDVPGNKDRRDLRQMRARCLMAVNRPVDARSILTELTAHRDGDRDLSAWIELGQVAAVLQDKVNLRNAGMRVTGLAPDRPDGYLFRALYHRIDGRLEESLAALDLAVQRSGSDPNPLILRSLVLHDLGRSGEARASLDQALAIEPTSSRAQQLLGVMNGSAITGHDDAAQ